MSETQQVVLSEREFASIANAFDTFNAAQARLQELVANACAARGVDEVNVLGLDAKARAIVVEPLPKRGPQVVPADDDEVPGGV